MEPVQDCEGIEPASPIGEEAVESTSVTYLLGVVSVVVGVISLVPAAGLFSLGPVIAGHFAFARARRAHNLPALLLAVLGLIIGYFGVAFSMLAILFLIRFFTGNLQME